MQRSHPSLSQSPAPSSSIRKTRWFVTGLISLVLLLGIGFRVIYLEQKAYWVDEVHTAVRVAGYTKADITAERFNNQAYSVMDLKTYQIPGADPSLGDVLNTLAQHPEHPPLYYLLARWWMQAAMALGGSPSVTVTRSLSILFSLLALPCVVGLCQELFRSKQTALIALTIFALSPLHILYGQEAREYSLWTVITLLSCWAFLRAVRQPSVKRWTLYGLTLTVGWYSHLLFATVAIAHTLYVFLYEHLPSHAATAAAVMTNLSQANDDGLAQRSSSYGPLVSPKIPFLITLAISLLFFSPWIGVFLHQFGQVQNVVDATQRDPSLSYLVNVWGRNLSRVWFSADLGSANILWVAGVMYALGYLWQTLPKRISVFILLLIGVNALGLMVPDAITGGISSTRIRYLIPAYVGIQLAIAHLFSHHLLKRKGWVRRGWQMVLIGVFTSGAIAGCINTTHVTHWAKSDKSLYYSQMAEVINASEHPLVITDNSATYTLVLAHQLKDAVNVQLVDLEQLERPRDLAIPHTVNGSSIGDIFLFAPSPPLRRVLEKKGMGPFEPVVRQSDRFQLLKAKRR